MSKIIANHQLLKAESEISKDLLNYILTGQNHNCKSYHIHGTCSDRMIKKTGRVFKSLLKINIPIHVIPALIFKLKAMSEK